MTMHPTLKTKQPLGIPSSLLLAMSALATLPAPVRAVQTFYVGPNNGTWTNGNNWDGGTAPAAGDDAVIGGFIPGRTTDVNVTFDAAYTSAAALSSVTLDAAGTTGSVILNQTSAGSSLYAGNEVIGSSTARNFYNQSAGTNTFTGTFTLGANAGSSGTYNLSGNGTLTVTNSEYIGSSGNGVFNQTGGTHNPYGMGVGGTSDFFGPSGGTGVYTLSGGFLSIAGGRIDGLYVGSKGTFDQSAGTNTVGYKFSADVSVDGGGTYNLSGGNLSVPGGSFDGSGSVSNKGTFNFTGGTLS